MMFRETGETTIAIPQPSHAWLSGQAIRAWGNADFGAVAPYEDVCLGAEQHDIGWLTWERAPTLNPKTGRPHAFRELDLVQHSALWRQGADMALALARYPALLVSLHGTNLYRSIDLRGVSPAGAAAVTAFLHDHAVFQQVLRDSLAGEHCYEQHVSPLTLERNRLLVSAADRLSIAICTGLRDVAVCTELKDAGQITNVPTAGGHTTLRVVALDMELTRFAVSPWPFGARSISLACEGYEMPKSRFTDQNEMRSALRTARRVRIMAKLVPGG